GLVSAIEARAVGRSVGLLGGGRSRKGDALDHGVGVWLHAKVGDGVSAGEAIATVYHRDGRGLDAARTALLGAIEVADTAVPQPLIIETGLS
ncbi:MAG TPA: pyrimidine-nucleoside phosphorylase, partial [Trueperaceae bacterium]|nr:pyrimidine-nucleoside phosphorylase [Trueperaceae bacterium]